MLESFFFYRPLSYLNSLFQPQIFYVFEKPDYSLGSNSTAFIATAFNVYVTIVCGGVVDYPRCVFNPKNYKNLHGAPFRGFLFIKQMYIEHLTECRLTQ